MNFADVQADTEAAGRDLGAQETRHVAHVIHERRDERVCFHADAERLHPCVRAKPIQQLSYQKGAERHLPERRVRDSMLQRTSRRDA